MQRVETSLSLVLQCVEAAIIRGLHGSQFQFEPTADTRVGCVDFLIQLLQRCGSGGLGS